MERPITYAVKNKDLETRMESRSGGIFTALTDIILKQNGVVYGCILDKNYTAYHYRATTVEERNLMRGSKYVQSRMENCFIEVKKDLEVGLNVLFSGTSCQVMGLKLFLGKEYDNLLCIDILCHGVPSPKVWRETI